MFSRCRPQRGQRISTSSVVKRLILGRMVAGAGLGLTEALWVATAGDQVCPVWRSVAEPAVRLGLPLGKANSRVQAIAAANGTSRHSSSSRLPFPAPHQMELSFLTVTAHAFASIGSLSCRLGTGSALSVESR